MDDHTLLQFIKDLFLKFKKMTYYSVVDEIENPGEGEYFKDDDPRVIKFIKQLVDEKFITRNDHFWDEPDFTLNE